MTRLRPISPGRQPDIVRISVDLPSDVLFEYTEQALARNITVEQIMSERLSQAVSYTAVRPLYLDDNQHRAIENVLGKKAETGDDLVAHVTRLATMRIESTPVVVQGHVLERLHTRCFGMQFPDYIKLLTTRALETEAGLR